MTFTLIEKRQETPTITTFVFDANEDFTWTAGQLLHYTLPHDNPDDRGTERYFTISSAPFQKHPTITTRFAGEKSSTFKKALFSLPIGATMEADGLEGEFTLEDSSQPVVFIAGGIGITPYHAILQEMDHRGDDIKITLLYANSSTEIPFKSELDALAQKHPGLVIHYIIDPNHVDEQAIRAHVSDIATPTFYISGPEPMVEALGKTLEGMGVAEQHLKHDFFPGYTTI